MADVDAVGEQQTAREIGDNALFVEVDVSVKESVSQMVEQAKRHCGPIGILVNNASVYYQGNVLEVVSREGCPGGSMVAFREKTGMERRESHHTG